MIAAALLVLAARPAVARADTVITLGDTATVVAFVGAERSEIVFSADWAQVLAGFQPDLDAARADLEKLGVLVREVYSPTVLFRSNGREWRLDPDPASLLSGYYLWSPRGPTYVCPGARGKEDLLRTVAAFLDQVRTQIRNDLPGCTRLGP